MRSCRSRTRTPRRTVTPQGRGHQHGQLRQHADLPRPEAGQHCLDQERHLVRHPVLPGPHGGRGHHAPNGDRDLSNGGETLTGNAAATIQWTATDAGGVAAISIDLLARQRRDLGPDGHGNRQHRQLHLVPAQPPDHPGTLPRRRPPTTPSTRPATPATPSSRSPGRRAGSRRPRCATSTCPAPSR